eukprot:2531420-Rhodomonas_salina.1
MSGAERREREKELSEQLVGMGGGAEKVRERMAKEMSEPLPYAATRMLRGVRIATRMLYAMCGTELAYGATRRASEGAGGGEGKREGGRKVPA